MIQFIENKNIDKRRWDETIATSRSGLVFSYSWFLDTVCRGWDALVEDDYKFIFPLPWKNKFGFRYIYQPAFTNQLGVFSTEEITNEKLNSFLNAIPLSFRYVDLGLNFRNTFENRDFILTTRAAQHIDLKTNYEKVRKGYSENLKRNLRKAESAGLKIKMEVPPQSVTEYFQKAKGDELKMYDENDYRSLTTVNQILIQKEHGFCAGVLSADDSLLAAASFMFSHERIFYLKGAANSQGREAGAMHFLMDNILQQYAGKIFHFDFGGSVIPSVARFYKSFGAEDYFYAHVKRNRLPFYLRWLKK
ncbi:MAG: hypothetical protein JJE25_02360 [Bacteroidia bacterium]|nr:hypothetical protein [Bacteroidia bacterium]